MAKSVFLLPCSFCSYSKLVTRAPFLRIISEEKKKINKDAQCCVARVPCSGKRLSCVSVSTRLLKNQVVSSRKVGVVFLRSIFFGELWNWKEPGWNSSGVLLGRTARFDEWEQSYVCWKFKKNLFKRSAYVVRSSYPTSRRIFEEKKLLVRIFYKCFLKCDIISA